MSTKLNYNAVDSFIRSEVEKLLDKLGKLKMGKACIYFKKLTDLNLDVLEKICPKTIKHHK